MSDKKEQLYTVFLSRERGNYTYLDNECNVRQSINWMNAGFLTEEQIKAKNPKYWVFAEPVKSTKKRKFNVYWGQDLEDAKENKEHHGTFDTEDEAWDSIHEWWEKNNFEPRYTRYWKSEENLTMIDYGSHTRFYMIEEVFD